MSYTPGAVTSPFPAKAFLSLFPCGMMSILWLPVEISVNDEWRFPGEYPARARFRGPHPKCGFEMPANLEDAAGKAGQPFEPAGKQDYDTREEPT